jgi:hypothetical protein
MKYILFCSAVLFNTMAFANDSANDFYLKETIKCGAEGCSVVCHEPGNRWDSFLQSKGNIEVTYYFDSGTRQLKADMGNGHYTILDTNPQYQSCRITGVVS